MQWDVQVTEMGGQAKINKKKFAKQRPCKAATAVPSPKSRDGNTENYTIDSVFQ